MLLISLTVTKKTIPLNWKLVDRPNFKMHINGKKKTLLSVMTT